MRWVVLGPHLHIPRRVAHDQPAEARGEAVAIEDEGVQQLAARERHQHPTAIPARPALEPAALLQPVVRKLERARHRVDGNAQPDLAGGADA